jgi:hypothetical protein
MRTIMTLLLAGSLLAAPTPAVAQLGIGAEAQWNVYRGASRDTAVGNLGEGFRPYRPILFTLRPEWRTGRFGVALGLSYGQPDIADEGEPLTIVLHTPAKLLELAPEFSYALLRAASGMRLRLHAGPVADLWQVPGEDGIRVRPGGQVAASAEFPIAARLQAVVRAHAVLTRGLFTEIDLPPGFEVRAMHRLGVSLGLRYGR